MLILKPKMELRATGICRKNDLNYSVFNVILLLCLVQLGTTNPSDNFKSKLRSGQNVHLHINRATYSNEETYSDIEIPNAVFKRNVPKRDNDTEQQGYTKSSGKMVNLDSLRDRYFERGQDFYKEPYENDTIEEKDTTELNEPTFGLLIDQQTNTAYSNQQGKESSTSSVNETYSDKEITIGRVTYDDFISSAGQETTTESENYTEEVCVGQVDYCNLTKEEYVALLDDYIFPMPYEWVLIASHTVVFFVGLIGNALVCVAVYRNHSMRTVTNYFIVNLAVADFMVILFCLPPTVLWDVTETWFFGNAMCRIVLYFQSVSVTVSVLTLTFISVDRWYAICFPLKFKSTTGRAKTAIFVIWLLSLLFNIPEFVVLQIKKSASVRFELDYFTQCAPTWSTESDLMWHIIKAVILYTLPLLLMTIAYCQIVRVLWKSNNIPGHCESQKYTSTSSPTWVMNNRRSTLSAHANASTEAQVRTRRKAAKMLVAVVVMFAVCYFPVHLISVLRYAFGMQQTDVIAFLALLSHWLCYANSAVNPLIYNFMSGKFRQEFRRSFFECRCLGLGPARGAGSGAGACGRGAVSRAGTRRSESGASYRLAHLSNCDRSERDRTERDRNRLRNHTSFVENNNRKQRSDSVSDNPATRLTVDMDSVQ